MNPIFVINLPNSENRLKEMNKKLANNTYEVIEAYDSVTRQKQYIKDRMSSKQCLFKNMYVGYVKQNERPGVIGCFSSHVQIYNKMVDENIQIAYVLEDDILITTSLPILNPDEFENVDMVYINDRNYGIGPKYNLGTLEVQKCKPKWGTDGYIVTLNGAKKLIGCCFPMVAPIDTQIRHFANNSIDTCEKTKVCSKIFPLNTKTQYAPDEYKHISKYLTLNVLKTTRNYVIHNKNIKSDISNK